MKLKYILALVFAASCNLAHSQEGKLKLIVMGVPQQLFLQGIRIELDMAQKKENRWLTLAPQFYYSSNPDASIINNSNFDKMAGAGIDLFSRQYLSKNLSASGAYVTWGGGYRYLSLNTTDYLWEEYKENGLTFYRRQLANYDVNIHSFNARVVGGLQFFLQRNMAVDVYLGLGIRLSSHQRPEGSYVLYNTSSFDYGYTGTQFIGGLRFGVGW